MSKKAKVKNYLAADEQDESRLKEVALSDIEAFKKLFVYMSSKKWSFVLALALIFLASSVSMISARYMGSFVEEGLVAGQRALAMKMAIVFISLEAGYILFQAIGRFLLAKISSLVILNIREAVFNKLQQLPISYYDRQPQGRIVTRATHDIEELDRFFSSGLGRLLMSIFLLINSVAAMILTNWRIGLLLTLSMLPASIFIYGSRTWFRDVNRKMSKASSATNAKLSELIGGIDVIRTFGKELWAKQEYDKTIDEYVDSGLKANRLYCWSRPLISFLCSFPLLGLIALGGRQVMLGAMGIGLFVAFVRYTERFFHAVMMVAHEINQIQQAFTSAERISTFLGEKEEKDLFQQNQQMLQHHDLGGKITFKDVTMGYTEGKPVLKGLSFEIQPGQSIGLVGTTGSGKTTTVSLLSRLYEFQKGEILLDDMDIRSFERNFLRDEIGFVSQDVVIIRGSLRENLTFNQNCSDEQILQACERTGLAEVMQQVGITLDSEILEGGSNISVGQRQLVALTRIFLKDPKILILDEATANIDPHMEMIIQAAIDKLMSDRTCLIIAHRLATLKKCDRIFVFEQGVLVEQGDEVDLKEQKGKFWSLYNSSEFIGTQTPSA